MNRKLLVEKVLQRGHILRITNSWYKNWIEKFIEFKLKSDIGKGDITTNTLFDNGHIAKALIVAKQSGIIAGVEEVAFLYNKFGIKVSVIKKDGSVIKNNDIILRLKGNIKALFNLERTASDILQRMSGIATLTQELIKKVKNEIRIAATRKTAWCFLDKKAVYLGGGLTHRLGLWDAILIKDNHLNILKKELIKTYIKEAIKRVYNHHSRFIEIEVTNKKEAIEAAQAFKEADFRAPCLIMLDNLAPEKIKEIINELKKKSLYENILIEASGGITPNNILDYVNIGVDVVSLGYLTHSSKIFNLKQIIE